MGRPNTADHPHTHFWIALVLMAIGFAIGMRFETRQHEKRQKAIAEAEARQATQVIYEAKELLLTVADHRTEVVTTIPNQPRAPVVSPDLIRAAGSLQELDRYMFSYLNDLTWRGQDASVICFQWNMLVPEEHHMDPFC